MTRIENITACELIEFIDWLWAHEDHPKLYQQFQLYQRFLKRMTEYKCVNPVLIYQDETGMDIWECGGCPVCGEEE